LTVCVAAVAKKSILIGASDRMLTAGDIEFEPAQAKVWLLTPSICALIAGDAGIQAEIFKRVHKQVIDWIVADPKTWVNVRDVVSIYGKEFRALLRERAEAQVLSPHGLDLQTFLATQASMSPEVVADLAGRLSSFQFDSQLEAIIMGIDQDGPSNIKTGEKLIYPQLYALDGDKPALLTTAGFAAVGIGKSHAESQIMLAGHSPMNNESDTALLVYTAKKRAEVAPGVGKETDMVTIGPGLGSFAKIEDQHIAYLETVYQRITKSNKRILAKTQREVGKYVDKVVQERTKAAQQQEVKPSDVQKSEGLQ